MGARAQRKVAALLRYCFLLGLLSLQNIGVEGASRHVEDAVLSQLRDRMPPSASRVDDILRIVRNDVGEVTNLSLWLGLNLPAHSRIPVLRQQDLESLARLNKLDALDLLGARLEPAARLPDSWATLKHLQFLRLDMAVRGTIPGSWAKPGAFPALHTMILTNCDLEGSLPAEWGHPGALPQLRELVITDSSRLGGTLPPSWAEGFASLEALVLKRLGVVGQLPAKWLTGSAFPSLRELTLSDCNISGGLPEEIQLRSLTQLDLSGCQLTGTLPAWQTGAGPQLEWITLGRNHLSGSVPASWLVGGLPKVTKLDLEHNQLTLPLHDLRCPDHGLPLEGLYLRHNRLSGRLPWSENSCGSSPFPSLSRLSLEGNQLSGALPSGWPDLLPNLTHLYLSSNSLTGPIPGSWAEPAAFVNLVTLDLSLNQLTGPVIKDLLEKRTLTEVNLTSNQLSGTLPAWRGYTNATYFMLDVSSNQLTGSIPESWTDHHWREQPNAFLNFSRNQLTGPFPTSWSLEGHPDWLQASAVSIDVHGNRLSGSLPWQLFDGGYIRLAVSPGNEDVCITERPAKMPRTVTWGRFEAPMRGGGLCSLEELQPTLGSVPLCLHGEENIHVCASPKSSGISLLWPLSVLLATLVAGALVLIHTRKMRSGAQAWPPRIAEDCETGATLPLLPETMSQVTLNLVERMLSSPEVRLATPSPPPGDNTNPLTASGASGPRTTGCEPWRPPLRPLGTTASQPLSTSAGVSEAGTAACLAGGTAATDSTADYVLAQYRKEMAQQQVQGEGGCCPGLGPSSMLRRLRLADLSFVRDSQGSLVVLGKGSFATVLEARLWGTQRVAVKVAERSDMAAIKLVQEAELLHGCYHPNVLQVFGTCTAGELVFLVSELMERGTLAANLHSDELKWGARGRQVLLEVAQGLDYLHSIGVLHGDLKPANILLSESFQVKIADVGNAHHLVRSEAPACAGTVMFAAPEQLLGQTCTKKADVFSLGLVMLSVLVGGQPRARAQYRDIDLRTHPGCPPELADIISACLEEDPTARPTTQQLIGQLLACQ